MSNLPAYARIKHYRDLAQEIRREATTSESVAYLAYLRIAENWEILAAEVERRALATRLH